MIDYYEYIKSDLWKQRTEKVRERNGGRCELCLFRKGSSVHHRTYVNLGSEKDEDLIHVCDSCHKAIHRLKENHFLWESRRELLNQLQKEVEKFSEQPDTNTNS